MAEETQEQIIDVSSHATVRFHFGNGTFLMVKMNGGSLDLSTPKPGFIMTWTVADNHSVLAIGRKGEAIS